MKKLIPVAMFLLFGFTGFSQTNGFRTLYEFKATGIDGEEFDFSKLKGKKVLIVNTASECGYTPQYKELEELYKTYGGDRFEIIGFPSNDFGAQEPGTNEQIKAFCSKNYGVTFPMMSKISVTGKEQHPLYAWLTHKEQNGVQDAEVKWNFQKFLIDENGHWYAMVAHRESPVCERILDWLNDKD